MVSKYFSASLLLAIVGICSCLESGYYDCPDDSKATVEVADIQKTVPASILGIETLEVRIPESGLLSQPLTCIIATDLSSDGSGGDVVLIGGGLGSKFVELRVTSKFWRDINYRFQGYVNKAATTVKPTTL